jgi:hypothetical protein
VWRFFTGVVPKWRTSDSDGISKPAAEVLAWALPHPSPSSAMAANRHLAAIAHDSGKFGQRRFFSAVPDAQRLNTRDVHGGRRSHLMGGGWVGG